MSISKNRWFDIFFHRSFIPSFIIIFFCLSVSAYLGYILPKTIANLFENYKDEQLFFEMIQILLTIYIVGYSIRVLYNIIISILIKKVILNIRLSCYRHWILNHETQRSKKANKEMNLGEVLARLMNDTETIRELITSGTFGIVVDFLFIGSCLYSFIQIDRRSGMILMGIESVAIIALIFGSRTMVRIFLKVRKEVGLLSRTVADVAKGVRENYYNDNRQFAKKKVKTRFRYFLKEQLKANLIEAGYYSLAESLYPIFLACVGIIFSYSPLVAGGVIASIIDLVQRSINPIKEVTGKMGNIQRTSAGVKRIDEFIKHVQSGETTIIRPRNDGLFFRSLEVHIDDFSYPGHSNQSHGFDLKGIHFKASKGDLVGLVGLSGSGKSTLLKILACDLLPDRGNLTIETEKDGIHIDFQDVTRLQHYREQISLVSQDSHIFTASLAFNISMSLHQDEEVENFWAMAREKLPYLKAWGVGPRDQINSGDISLGQKQLLSALRACFLKRPVVLFDEISSSLDSSLEMALRQLVLLVQKQALTLIVAHRVETLLYAQNILVMDTGRVVASGEHVELLDKSPLYRDFVQQMSQTNKETFDLLFQNEEQLLG